MDGIVGYSSFTQNALESSVETTELIRRLQEQKSALQPKIPDAIKKLKSLKKKKK